MNKQEEAKWKFAEFIGNTIWLHSNEVQLKFKGRQKTGVAGRTYIEWKESPFDYEEYFKKQFKMENLKHLKDDSIFKKFIFELFGR